MANVEQGNYVEVHYTGKLDDGTVFDSSEGKEPLKIVLGKGLLIKGFEDGLVGMAEGDEKTIDLTPDQAYGEPKEGLVQVVEKQHLGDLTPEVGMQIGIKAPTGQVFPATITKIEGEQVTLDANHPLAGKTLHFTLKVVATRAATAEDMKPFEQMHAPEQAAEPASEAPATEEAPAASEPAPKEEAAEAPKAEEKPAEPAPAAEAPKEESTPAEPAKEEAAPATEAKAEAPAAEEKPAEAKAESTEAPASEPDKKAE